MAGLFGTSGGSRGGKKNLVEFKAGKMHLRGKMCHPDERKGLIYVHQSDDSLMHFCWKDRVTGKVEDDLIIFPDDAEFKKVPQCTTGRVFVLKFTTNRKYIFWMQEPKAEKDEDHMEKINTYLNNPPTRGANSSSAGTMQELSGLGESDLSSLLGGMNQQQLLQLIGGMGGMRETASPSLRGARPASSQSQELSSPVRAQSAPETAAQMVPPTGDTADEPVTPQNRPATAATGAPSKPAASQLRLSDLQNALSNMASAGASQPSVDLSEALTSEIMIPLLADPGVRARLEPFLPKDSAMPSTESELAATATSPQFKQALSGFSQALASGQLGPVLQQFGLPSSAVDAANNGDVEAFVKAMQENAKKEEEQMDQD